MASSFTDTSILRILAEFRKLSPEQQELVLAILHGPEQDK